MQIPILGMPLKFGAKHGERLDQPRNILLRADGAGVKDERIMDGVAIQNLPVLRGIVTVRR